MHMIIVSYVLTVAVMLPASGWLADRVGVRNIFFTAIVLFTAGSLFAPGQHPRPAGVLGRRRDDGAGRPPDGDEDRPARSVYGGDDLRHPAGRSARCSARRWAGCWEYASTALDLPHQYPGGDRRRDRHPLSDAQLHHADPALRSLWLSAAGRRNGDPDPALDGQKGLGISPGWRGWWPSASAPCCSTCGPRQRPGAV